MLEVGFFFKSPPEDTFVFILEEEGGSEGGRNINVIGCLLYVPRLPRYVTWPGIKPASFSCMG